MMELDLHHKNGNNVAAINCIFNTLRLNSSVNHYKEMWGVYRTCCRVIINWALPRMRYEFRPVNDLSSSETGLVNQAYNFDIIDSMDSPDKILRVLVSSLKNLRKIPQSLDLSQRRV